MRPRFTAVLAVTLLMQGAPALAATPDPGAAAPQAANQQTVFSQEQLQQMLAYHDAQTEYASQDRNGNGALEYARRIFSSPGKHDGLYRADQHDGQVSALGPLFAGRR